MWRPAFIPRTLASLLCLSLLSLWTGTQGLAAFTLLSSNQLVFVNVDHAPMGTCSTMAYGYKGQPCGVGTSSGVYPYWNTWGGGLLIALSDSSGLRLLPFITNIAASTQFFADTNIQRTLNPGTDEYLVSGTGLGFTHYTPVWTVTNLNTATLAEKKRCFLPATWLVFTISNTNSLPVDFYFGLPVSVTPRTFANGAYQGYSLGEAALAVQSNSCELLSGTRLSSVFNGVNQGFAFHLTIPGGQTRVFPVIIAFYRSAVVDSRTGATYYYTSLFSSIDSVIDAAFAGFGDAQLRCQQLATALTNARLNPYRQFLASYALHSYMADTACLVDPQGGVHWWEMEGFFNYINTFDLTVDHAFFDACMQPWALRNVLDGYSGTLPNTGYSYESPLYDPTGTQVSTHGFSFYHDMGLWPTSGTGPAYGANMGDEELQSWILSAGLYWSHTGDDPWLTNNSALLQTCLNSMLLRDNTNAASRDGITKNVNGGEITTWDSLDTSLRSPSFSGRLTVRNWASYLALETMFNRIGDAADAATCQSMAAITAQTIVNRWNAYQPTLGYIPALLNGSATAATIPMIEGLAYPAAMGLTNAIDRTSGPYASMLQTLSNHTVAILVSGKGLDPVTGAWLSSSASQITWQSKMFIAQYAAEFVLGITNQYVDGSVDQVHASVQIQGAPYQGYCDAFYGTGALQGGYHYPRGLTTALWWLNTSNNPAFPAPTTPPAAPTSFTAFAGDAQALLLWQGVPLATGYNLKRSTLIGGPYALVTNGLFSSFVDSGLKNGSNYYYILTATNQIGQSGPSPVLHVTPVPAVATTISASLTNSQLTISWPGSYVGWILQTNNLGLGNPAAWGDVPDSITHAAMIFPTAANNSHQFFRLRHP